MPFAGQCGDLRADVAVHQLDPAARIGDHFAQDAGTQVAFDHRSVRVIAGQSGEAQPAAAQAEEVTARRDPDDAVGQYPRGDGDARSPQRRSRRRQDGERRNTAGEQLHQLADDLPLLARLPDGCDDGLAGLPEGRGLERLKGQREIVALVHGGHRQDVIAVRRGLGDVEVERHRQLERRERPLHLVAVGHREHGVSRADEQRPDLTIPWSQDLLGHQRRRFRADERAETTDPRPSTPVGAPQDGAHRDVDPALPGQSEAAEHDCPRGRRDSRRRG